MRQFWPILVSVLILTAVTVLGFTAFQAHQQKAQLVRDLQDRTRIFAESLVENAEPIYISQNKPSMERVLDKFTDRQKLIGMAVFDASGNVFASSAGFPENFNDMGLLTQSINTDKPQARFAKIDGVKVYEYASPLNREKSVEGSFLILQKADYINSAIWDIWKTNILHLLLQSLLIAIAFVFILRWLVIQPAMVIINSIRKIGSGQAEQELDALRGYSFFKPLSVEISKLSESLKHAKTAASEEARMRLEKIEEPWTAERLEEFIKAHLKGRKIFAVSNREPYVHTAGKSGIEWSVPPSGMVTALEPVMQACGGIWLASASGDADKKTADKEGKIKVPPDDPKYVLKRIWLTEKDWKGFYDGFCNEALWPLCHNAHNRPIFRKEDWQAYKKVNGKFAQNLLKEIRNVDRPIILVQDYHFALLPKMIKKSRPDAEVGIFWHIPWPSPEIFNVCPWHMEILEGMLGADIIGFQIQQNCNNFMDTVGKKIESIIDSEQFSVTLKGHLTQIRPFPISISFPQTPQVSQAQEERAQKMLQDLGIKSQYLGLGVDRMDYTKGILERFKAIEIFFDLYPAYKKKFAFLQVAPLSRESVEKYKEFGAEVSVEAERINAKFFQNGWIPIVLLKKQLSHQELYPLYRKANLCLITPLHDGMNLVAKEFVAARQDESGVLILSQFAGASRDLSGALIINPYNAEQVAQAMSQALAMPLVEQRTRMKKMRESIKNYNIFRWSAEFIKAIANIT